MLISGYFQNFLYPLFSVCFWCASCFASYLSCLEITELLKSLHIYLLPDLVNILIVIFQIFFSVLFSFFFWNTNYMYLNLCYSIIHHRYCSFFINKLSFYWDRIHIKLIILFTFKNWPFKNILVTDILYIKDIVQLSFLYHSKYFHHPKRKPHNLQVTTFHSSLPTPVNHKLAFSLYAFT